VLRSDGLIPGESCSWPATDRRAAWSGICRVGLG
jgi:hypothetical protein